MTHQQTLQPRIASGDRIFEGFLRGSFKQAKELESRSDILRLAAEPTAEGVAPSRVIASFDCAGLINDGGNIRRHEHFAVHIYFPPNYLVAPPNVAQILTVLTPNVWHANVADIVPVICVGRISPGTPLADILYQVHELWTWQKVAPHDHLNPAAAEWALKHRDKYPVDKRPLKWRAPAMAGGAR